jgi:hypothetical protein
VRDFHCNPSRGEAGFVVFILISVFNELFGSVLYSSCTCNLNLTIISCDSFPSLFQELNDYFSLSALFFLILICVFLMILYVSAYLRYFAAAQSIQRPRGRCPSTPGTSGGGAPLVILFFQFFKTLCF